MNNMIFTSKKVNYSSVLGLFVLLSLIIITSCNSGSKKTKVSPKDVKDAASIDQKILTDSPADIIKNMQKVDAIESAEMVRSAIGILEHRQKELGNKSHIILDKDLWEYNFVIAGVKKTSTNYMLGNWLDFNENLTYTYGFKDKKVGEGRYVYDPSTSLLLMVDADESIKPKEYQARISGSTMILDGNSTYKDYNINARLVRITEKPK